MAKKTLHTAPLGKAIVIDATRVNRVSDGFEYDLPRDSTIIVTDKEGLPIHVTAIPPEGDPVFVPSGVEWISQE